MSHFFTFEARKNHFKQKQFSCFYHSCVEWILNNWCYQKDTSFILSMDCWKNYSQLFTRFFQILFSSLWTVVRNTLCNCLASLRCLFTIKNTLLCYYLLSWMFICFLGTKKNEEYGRVMRSSKRDLKGAVVKHSGSRPSLLLFTNSWWIVCRTSKSKW